MRCLWEQEKYTIFGNIFFSLEFYSVEVLKRAYESSKGEGGRAGEGEEDGNKMPIENAKIICFQFLNGKPHHL